MTGGNFTRSVVVLGWMVLAAAAMGCADKAAEQHEDARRALATSTADATEPVVDEKAGFRLERPGAGWKMLHAADADALVPGALAGALGPEEIVGVVMVRPAASSLDAQVAAMAARIHLTEEAIGPAEPTDLGGQEGRKLLVSGGAQGIALRYAIAATIREGYGYELVAWGRAERTAPSGEDFAPWLQAFQLLDGPPSGELRASAAATKRAPKRADDIGAHYALRDGVYRDFEHRVRLESPAKDWQLRAGDRAQKVLLELYNPSLEVRGRLLAEPRAELDRVGYHRTVRERLGKTVRFVAAAETAPKMGDPKAMTSSGAGTGQDAGFSHLLITAFGDEAALQLTLWGPRERMTEHAASVGALVGAIEQDPALREVEATTDTYRDHRFGFEIVPPAGWLREEPTPPELRERGTLVRWQKEGRWLAVAAANLPGGDRGWMTALLEQLLRDALGPLSRGALERSDLQVAERPAVHLRWQASLQQVDALLFERAGTVFALLTVDGNGHAFEHVSGKFALIR